MRLLASLFCLFVASILWTGCDPRSVGDKAAPEAIMVSIRNDSEVDFDEVVVGFPEEQENYGALAAGGKSKYREVSSAYRYAYVEVQAGGGTYKLQPTDYVGEELLGSGRFTYALDLEEQGLALAFVE